MNINEELLLQKVFWPSSKEKLAGNLVYNYTSEDFTETYEISVSRTNEKFEIFFGVSPTFSPKEMNYFVQMFFDRKDNEFQLDKKKTSPELMKDEDILNTLDSIQNNIMKMSAKPEFFATGVLSRPENKYTI